MLPQLRPRKRWKRRLTSELPSQGENPLERAAKVLGKPSAPQEDRPFVESIPQCPIRTLIEALDEQGAIRMHEEDVPPFEGKDGVPLSDEVVAFLRKGMVGDVMPPDTEVSIAPLDLQEREATPQKEPPGTPLEASYKRRNKTQRDVAKMFTKKPLITKAFRKSEPNPTPWDSKARGCAPEMTIEDLRALHLRVLVINRHKKGVPVQSLKDICSTLKVVASGTAAPSATDLLVVKILFDAMTDARGVTAEILKYHGWMCGGRVLDMQTFRKIDRSRNGVLRLGDMVRFFFPQLEPKEVRALTHKLDLAHNRSESITVISGPPWLARYPAAVVDEAYSLFVSLGPDPTTGLLHISKLADRYMSDATAPLNEGDVEEMTNASHLDLAKFVALVEHAFQSDDYDSD